MLLSADIAMQVNKYHISEVKMIFFTPAVWEALE